MKITRTVVRQFEHQKSGGTEVAIYLGDTPIQCNSYLVMRDAVERGTACGWHRAFKHTNTPSADQACEEICRAIMAEICDYFEFPAWVDEPCTTPQESEGQK